MAAWADAEPTRLHAQWYTRAGGLKDRNSSAENTSPREVRSPARSSARTAGPSALRARTTPYPRLRSGAGGW